MHKNNQTQVIALHKRSEAKLKGLIYKNCKSPCKFNQNKNSQKFANTSTNFIKLHQTFDYKNKNIKNFVHSFDNYGNCLNCTKHLCRKPLKGQLYTSNSPNKLIKSPPKFSKASGKYKDLKDSEAYAAKESKLKIIIDECTFTPNIKDKAKKDKVRSAQRFYQDQKNFELKKVSKLCKLEKEISKQNNGEHKPKLSKNTEELALIRNLNETDIYKRLTKNIIRCNNQEENKADKLNKHYRVKSNEPKSPRINEFLYNDAIKRQKSRDENERSKSTKRLYLKTSSKTTDLYAYNKLVKEFQNAWNLIFKDSSSYSIAELLELNDISNQDRSNLTRTAYIFTALGYLSQKGHEDDKEKKLFYDLWTLLQGEESGGVTHDALLKIVLTISGFYKGIDIEHEISSKSNIPYIRIGNIMNEDFTDCVISQKQAQLIHKIFRKFCLNRFQNKQTNHIIKSQARIKDECVFKPTLNKYSQELANKRRTKHNSTCFNLYESMIEKSNKNKEWRESQNQLKEQEIMRECTFTPEIRSSSRPYHNRRDSRLVTDKSTFNEKSTERCKRHQKTFENSPADHEIDLGRSNSIEPKKIIRASSKTVKSKVLDSNKKSVENTISRMREAALENKIIAIMKQTRCSRKRAIKLLNNESISNLSSMLDRLLDVRSDRERSKSIKNSHPPKYTDANPQGDERFINQNKIFSNDDLTLSSPKFLVSDPKLKKESKTLHSMQLSEIMADPELKPRSFLKNLEECLDNFISEKSNTSTPHQIPESAPGTPTIHPLQENNISSSLVEKEESRIEEKKMTSQSNCLIGSAEEDCRKRKFDKDQEKESARIIDHRNNNIRVPTFGDYSDKITEEDNDDSEDFLVNDEILMPNKLKSSALLFIDVSIGPNQTERIIVYEDDTPEQLADDFAKKHNLNKYMKQKLIELLNMEISGVLDKIEEENSEYLSDDF